MSELTHIEFDDVKTRDERTVTAFVTGAPDDQVYDGSPTAFRPEWIQITYMRFGSGDWSATGWMAWGRRVLKSGFLGEVSYDRSWWNRDGRPEWMDRFAQKHLPS